MTMVRGSAQEFPDTTNQLLKEKKMSPVINRETISDFRRARVNQEPTSGKRVKE